MKRDSVTGLITEMDILSQEQLDEANSRIELALNNQASIHHFSAVGMGQSHRDISLQLSEEESVKVFLLLQEILKAR